MTDVIQRLVLECGDSRISGPWDALVDEGTVPHMIGDITWCEVCPRVLREVGAGTEMCLRQIVAIQKIPAGTYRAPSEERSRARRDQMARRQGLR